MESLGEMSSTFCVPKSAICYHKILNHSNEDNIVKNVPDFGGETLFF